MIALKSNQHVICVTNADNAKYTLMPFEYYFIKSSEKRDDRQ